MKKIKPISRRTCPACQHNSMAVFVEIEDVPIHCNLLWSNQEAALNAPKGDIRLGFCQSCEMIYNLSFEPHKMQYTQAYETSLHSSPRFQVYAQQLVKRLIEKYGLNGKDIIEIGCGKGEFLSMLCEGGRNRGVGFDTSYEETGEEKPLTFIRDYYSEAYAEYRADFICCRHVLEHIEFPRGFLSKLRSVIGDRKEMVVFFEVPNALYTFRDLGIWDIIYEHCSYFGAGSLKRVFSEAGFNPLELDEVYGGQFLCIEASPANIPSNVRKDQKGNQMELSNLVLAFPEKYKNKVEEWQDKLRTLGQSGKRIVVWGAGSKGVTFLNTLKGDNRIDYVVDINLHKQGKFIAGSGQQIVSPDFLRDYQPHVIIIMNPIYYDEVRQMTKNIAVAADLVSA